MVVARQPIGSEPCSLVRSKRPKAICKECGTLVTRRYLQYHIDRIHKKLKLYKCNQCEKSFGHKNSYNLHVRTIHEKLKPFKCDTCQMAFSEKQKVKKHILSVHTAKNEVEKKFPCDICTKKFVSGGALRFHMKIHQDKIPCGQCGKLILPHTMKQHVARIHEGSKKIDCHLCGKSLIHRNQNINQHLAVIQWDHKV